MLQQYGCVACFPAEEHAAQYVDTGSRLSCAVVMFAIAMTLAPPERATALLQEMCSMYEANRNEQLAPTVGHYMLAMRSWAKAGNPQEAERLLGELTSAYRGGNDKLQPGHEVSICNAICHKAIHLEKSKLTHIVQKHDF